MEEITETVALDSKNDAVDNTLKLEIHNLIPEIEEYIKNGVLLSPETERVIRIFNHEEDFSQILSRKDREGVLGDLNSGLKNFNRIDLMDIVPRSISTVQKLNPEKRLNNTKMYLLFTPTTRRASALKGEGVAININAFKNNKNSKEYLENCITHELTHTFLSSLGKEPIEGNNDLKREMYDFLWWEGIAQYVEPYHSEIQNMIEKDLDSWKEILSLWFKIDSKENKKELMERIKGLSSFKEVMRYRHGMGYEELLEQELQKDTEDEAIKNLLVREGLGYFLGAILWKNEIGEGKEIRDLVMKGSEEMSGWIEGSEKIVK